MRRWRLGLVGLLCGVLAAPLLLQGAIFEMQNGEVIIGEMSTPLQIEAGVGGILDVPLNEIASMKDEQCTFTDGMTLKGRIKAETLAVTTRYGTVQMPVAQIKTLKLGKEVAAVPTTQGFICETQGGDKIVGEINEPLKVTLELGGTLEVPSKDLAAFADGRFALLDGTVLKGLIAQETLVVKTRFGGLKVPSTAIKAIKVVGETTDPQSKPCSSSVGIEFVLIPAGQFMMGSDKGDPNETSVHEVRISRPFCLGKYEVTQGQWQAVMGSNPSRFQDDANLPVEKVSWLDVQEFIQRLNAQEGGTPYRLPTEAEWEYAVRAGSTTAYYFGDDARQLQKYAWYEENAEGRTHPVGQKQPNAWGLYDMSGNVWEWVQDWYSNTYSSEAVTDPQGPALGSHRVLRGGGWLHDPWFFRSSLRSHTVPETRGANVGFRLLRTVE